MIKQSKVVFVSEKLEKAFESMPENEILKKHIKKAIENLKENAFSGTRIPKRLFPRDYVIKYNISNLWKYDLPDGWRFIYTLVSPNKVEILSVILEWFNHPEYERRFKY